MIKYRKATIADIPGFLICLRDVYGDHSYYRKYYDPAYLSEIIDNIFVADANGEVVGTLVLSRWGCEGNDRELSTFMIRSDMRHTRIGSDFLSHTMNAIRDLPSVKGAPITYNTHSQAILERLRFVPTGISFGAVDLNLLTAGKAESTEKKPIVLVICNFNVTKIGNIYVPQAARGAAEQLYARLGVSCTMEAPSGGDTFIPSESRLWHEHNEQFHIDDIYIIQYGKDCFERILEIEAHHAHPLRTSNLFINMKDPGAPAAYETFLKAGSIYAGFMPLSAGFEYIILHRAGKVQAAAADIHFAEDTGKMLRETLRIVI
jgi:N-acetylglutamate synthase-like GNAT family acetyltransferase